MLKNILFVLSALAIASAQIPSLRWCPEYVPMTDFDMSRFLGVWYEAEKYFQILDPVSRCVMTNYTQGPDGKYHVSNQVTNRFTGIKRVVDGEIKTSKTKNQEGQLHVKYTDVPLIPETQYVVLETDYKSYAVLWSCSGFGPISAQSAWVMTRARIADGTVLQKAYGVLDKYKISRTFFVKTNQEDCAWFDEVPATTSKPLENISTETPIVEESVAEEITEKPTKIADAQTMSVPQVRSVADETIVELSPLVSEEGAKDSLENIGMEEAPKEEAVVPPVTVPEIILKAADRAKETVHNTIDEVKKFEPIETIKETFEKPAEKIQEALAAPIDSIKETFQQSYEHIKETLQKPIDKIKEVLTMPASENKEQAIDNGGEKSKLPIDEKKEETSR